MIRQVLFMLVSSMTPALVGTAREFAIAFKEKAGKTTNPYDDIVAGLLCALLGVE